MGGSQQDRLDRKAIERFAHDLDALVEPTAKIGLAVSGGPDSLALLLLAAAARPELVEAASVDHALRPESRSEAELVARVCGSLGIPHQILTVRWDAKPESALQERARQRRYAMLADWAAERELEAIATGHHLDDQAETLLMRLARGAGVTGLAAMRPRSRVPGGTLPLVRPLLGWRRDELEAICAAASVSPVTDPSNDNAQFERVRMRKALAGVDWLDSGNVARSARILGEADDALAWAAAHEWERRVTRTADRIIYEPGAPPAEIRRRIITRAVIELAHEGEAALRGRELDTVLQALESGGTATLRGVLCTGGATWRFAQAPERRR